MIAWLVRLRLRIRELRWWLVAADTLRSGGAKQRARLGSLLAALLALRVFRARLRKLRRVVVAAATLQRGDVETVLRRSFVGRVVGVRIYRRLWRWGAGHRAPSIVRRWRAL